jgi:hypothetical protein
MSHIQTDIVKISQLTVELESFVTNAYGLRGHELRKSLYSLYGTLDKLKPDLYAIIEYPYVDRIYTNTFYSYFATKNNSYSKHSARISLFSSEISYDDFRSNAGHEKLKGLYLGFLTIRPTFPKTIGRSVLYPKALKNDALLICKATFDVTANGLKFKASGFPHASQDGEMMTCAESTIWSMLEYFGTRYPDYRPVMPSEVHSLLSRFSSERLTPSTGLTGEQISFALKELGFGVVIYRKTNPIDLFKIIKTYVESGIPIVALLKNDRGVGHAVNIIGRECVSPKSIKEIQPSNSNELLKRFSVVDFTDIHAKYVFIDDNLPPYSITDLENPAEHYLVEQPNSKWAGCKITQIIVPLHRKVFLEANRALPYLDFLLNKLHPYTNIPLWKKSFLSSSRSYKEYVALNNSLVADAKEILLNTTMPKFVWVLELSDMDQIVADLLTGLIIVDATEPKRHRMIAALVAGKYYDSEFNKFSLPLQPFTKFEGNVQ